MIHNLHIVVLEINQIVLEINQIVLEINQIVLEINQIVLHLAMSHYAAGDAVIGRSMWMTK